MGEIIGFAGSAFFVLFSLCVLLYALSELKIFHGDVDIARSGIFYTFGIMFLCLLISFIFYTVAKKNINSDLMKLIWGGVNGKMNALTSNFSVFALKSSGFMPLYPIIVTILGKICFGQFEFAAMMLSTVCMSLSMYYFYLTYGKQGWFLPLFPLAFTGFMALPDSMALLFSIMIFYTLQKERLVCCFFLCILLVSTDIRGIFIVLPIYMLTNDAKKLWVVLGAVITAVLLYLFYGAFAAEALNRRWFALVCAILLVLAKKKEITAELAYGMLLIAVGYLFPFARTNLLLAFPVAVALQTIENTYLRYFALFTSCTLLAFMLVTAI